MEECVGYFKSLLGEVEDKVVRGERGVRREGDNEQDVTKVVRTVGKLKEDKAMGGDGISEEVWKFGGERLMDWVWKQCNKVWKGLEWIEEWSDGILVPIRKKRGGL